MPWFVWLNIHILYKWNIVIWFNYRSWVKRLEVQITIMKNIVCTGRSRVQMTLVWKVCLDECISCTRVSVSDITTNHQLNSVLHCQFTLSTNRVCDAVCCRLWAQTCCGSLPACLGMCREALQCCTVKRDRKKRVGWVQVVWVGIIPCNIHCVMPCVTEH